MSWLFSGLSGISLLIALACIVCIKFPNARFLVIGLCAVVFFGFSTYCISDLAFYYGAEGGIYGELEGLFQTNIVDQSEEGLSFSLRNVELKQLDGGYYGATMRLDKTPTFAENTSYYIFVNGVPASNAEVNTTYAKGAIKHNFYDKNKDIFLSDILDISFAFYKNYSTLQVTTYGGADAVNEWRAYFQREDFVITIEESTIGAFFADVTNDNTYTLTYYDHYNAVHATIEVTPGGQILFPEVPATYFEKNKCYAFDHWETEDGMEAVAGQVITSDLNLFAVYVEQKVATDGGGAGGGGGGRF